jgi:hypothetical protein
MFFRNGRLLMYLLGLILVLCLLSACSAQEQHEWDTILGMYFFAFH